MGYEASNKCTDVQFWNNSSHWLGEQIENRQKEKDCQTCGNAKKVRCAKKHCTLPKHWVWYNICEPQNMTFHGHTCKMPCPSCEGNHDAFSVGDKVSVRLPYQSWDCKKLCLGIVNEKTANGYVVTFPNGGQR